MLGWWRKCGIDTQPPSLLAQKLVPASCGAIGADDVSLQPRLCTQVAQHGREVSGERVVQMVVVGGSCWLLTVADRGGSRRAKGPSPNGLSLDPQINGREAPCEGVEAGIRGGVMTQPVGLPLFL